MDKAATGDLLRSAHLSNPGSGGDGPLAVDLSSRRVRLARRLREGVHQGVPLPALQSGASVACGVVIQDQCVGGEHGAPEVCYYEGDLIPCVGSGTSSIPLGEILPVSNEVLEIKVDMSLDALAPCSTVEGLIVDIDHPL
jgi:hypothetical protein